MHRNKTKEKVEAIFQIIILIVATISFSYIAGEIFDLKEIEIVSAQGSAPQGLTNEELTTLKQGLPNYPFTNQQLNQTLISLEKDGLLSRSDFTNAEKVSQAMRASYDDYNSQLDSGNAQAAGQSSFSSIVQSIIPAFAEISGADIQQGMYDATGGLKMCAETKNGRLCQPFASNVCDNNCKENCIDVELTQNVLPDDNECKLGLCYDEDEGTCESRSPRGACEQNNGKWYKIGDAQGEGLCRRGCCIINDQALFITQRQCEKKSISLGFELGGDNSIFSSDISEEPACIGEAYRMKNENTDGACTYPYEDGGKLDCKFVKGDECSEIGGTFSPGKLCSNAELNTMCTKLNSTNCVEGFDEIYWFDSCGNRENIYEGSSENKKDSSWNTGKLKAKEDSCALFSNGNPIANQGTCGNCDRFRGSMCGNETAEPIVQKLNDGKQGVVCLDMGCYDNSGKRIREHGESWCAYQGKIGVDSLLSGNSNDMQVTSILNIVIPQIGGGLLGGDRAVDTVGSSHFRVSCLNGKIETSACETARREVCVESGSNIDSNSASSGQFSQAACRKNRAMECFQYNPSQQEGRIIGMAGPQKAWKILRTKLQLTCGLDPDCFVLDVNLASGKDDTFKFSYCTPKYKLGFDLANPESGKQICSQASQSCTAVFVKKLSGLKAKWKCEANCDCVDSDDPDDAKPNEKFVKEMGRFCSSLGDCGSSVNYVGDLPGGKGYSTSMGKNPLKQLFSFASTFDFTSMLGLDAMMTIGDADSKGVKPIPADETKPGGNEKGGFNNFLDQQGILGIFSQIDSAIGNLGSGGGGGDYGVPDISPGTDTSGLTNVGLVAGGAGGAVLGYGYLTGGLTAPVISYEFASVGAGGISTVSAPTALAGFGGALAGAGIGAATVGFLIKMLGIGAGLSPGVSYALMGAGGIGGGIIGYNLATGAPLGFLGPFLVIVTIFILILLKLFGVGEVKEVQVNFECKQWVPPTGVDAGKCRSCGNDELSDGQKTFPCNKYSCQALGQGCVFVEGSEIPGRGGICEYSPESDTQAPLIISLREDILSEGFEYKKVELNNRVFEVRKKGEECLDQFESVTFGFNTNEYSTKCSISGKPMETIDTMVQISSGLNHSYTFNSRNLNAIGVVGIKEEERNDVQLYIVCQDIRGNANLGKEYIVKMCVVPRDLTPTLILDRDALLNLLIMNNAETKDITFNINEFSECKWDTSDKKFDEMQNDAQCNNFLQCRATIPIEQDEKQICIKCKDHPEWKGTDRETERNENTECVDSSLIRTDALEITSINPDNETIRKGALDTAIEVVVNTAGGVNNGEADCYWNLDNSGEILFQETGNRAEHKQILGGGTARLDEGEHSLKIKCVDNIGNAVRNETKFMLYIDTISPKVTRIYAEGNILYLIVNEMARCAFVNNKPINYGVCGFDVSKCGEIQGCEEMSLDFSSENYTKHSTGFDASKIYYIRCADDFNNVPSQCNVKVIKGVFV